MVVKIFRDISELRQAAAKAFIEIANQSIAKRGRFLVVLSGGSTPTKLYERLADEPLDWGRVHFFWGDERCVPVEDVENSYGQAKKVLFDKISATNIHRVKSELEPDSAATDYAHTLSQFADPLLNFPRFDLVLLGMGDDGHTASLFPGSPVDVSTPTLAVTAHYQDRPANRITLTPPVFNQAREVWFLVTGKSKAEALKHVIEGESNPQLYPAQRIRPANANLVWMIDEAAGSLLEK
jgi:6-phosphogluconolactonase